MHVYVHVSLLYYNEFEFLFQNWNDVSKSTIVNCWNHANIIEEKDKEEIINKINSENEKHTQRSYSII